MKKTYKASSKQFFRIVLTGSESTGKSTLAAALKDHLGCFTAPEYLRDYFRKNNGILTLADAIPVAQGQLGAEQTAEHLTLDSATKQKTKDTLIIIYDTNLLSSIVYNQYYYGENPEWIEQEFQNRSYDYYFLCDIDAPWKADGQRDRPKERRKVQALFAKELQNRNLPYSELSGTHEARLAEALKKIEQLTDNT